MTLSSSSIAIFHLDVSNFWKIVGRWQRRSEKVPKDEMKAREILRAYILDS